MRLHPGTAPQGNRLLDEIHHREGGKERGGGKGTHGSVTLQSCRSPILPPSFLLSHPPSPQAVYAMAFDKTGEFIASGALGGSLYVWSVKDGTIVRSFCKLRKREGRRRCE